MSVFYWLPPAIPLQKALAGSEMHTFKQQNGSCICEGSRGLWLIDLSKTNSPARSACVMCSRHKSKGNKALIIFAEEQKETGRTKTERVQASPRGTDGYWLGTADGSAEKRKGGRGSPRELKIRQWFEEHALGQTQQTDAVYLMRRPGWGKVITDTKISIRGTMLQSD